VTAYYIAGPMRSIPEFGFPAFDECERYLRLQDPTATVFSPANRDRSEGLDVSGLTGNENLDDLDFDLSAAFRDDFRFITEATHLVLLPDWSKSEGATTEKKVAELCGLEILYFGRTDRPACSGNPYLYVNPTAAFSDEERGEGMPEMDHSDVADLRRELRRNPGFEAKAGCWGEMEAIPDPELSRLLAEEAEIEANAARTGAERYLAARMKNPEYGDAYLREAQRLAGRMNSSTYRPSVAEGGRAAAYAETRVTSSTGGQKGQKDVQVSLLPVEALAETARVYAMGAAKYERENWRKGYEYHLSYDALQRHLMAFWGGEDNDPESGLPHLAHAAFHVNTLIVNLFSHPEFDDRP
jgi:hypothetical protein